MSNGEIKHIVVALDESGEPKKGLEKAIYIAKLSDAKITGVNVIKLIQQPLLQQLQIMGVI